MAAFFSGDSLNAIVGDVGQYATKIGFAGEDYPRSYFRSNVAVERAEEQQDDTKQHRRPIQSVNYDFLNRTIHKDDDGNYQPNNPIDPTTGLLYDPQDTGPGCQGADWHDQLQLLIRHGYQSALGTEPENHPFILAERSYNPPPLRQQILECLFEELQMPAVFLARDATLACYACGRTTGTVVDMGYGGTTITPVYDGYCEQKGIRQSPIGTLALDERVLKTLDHFTKKPFLPLYQVRKPNLQRAEPFHRLARLSVAQQCREEGVGAAVDTTATAVAFAVRNAPFKLPDGQTVTVPPPYRFAAANLLLGQDDESQQQREEACEDRKNQLSEFINATLALEEDDNNNDNNNNNKQDESAPPYTEATAVGISTPSTRRGRPRKSATSATMAAAATEVLPKKKKKSFSNRHLQKACTSYLQAHLEHLTSAPLANMVCDAAYRCDRDQQAQLLGNVVLAGGGACLGPTEQAVPDFLRQGVEAIIHQHTPGWRVKVLSPGASERAVCSWLGGSILGSLGTFHDMWITRAEYEEYGTAIVNRKCP